MDSRDLSRAEPEEGILEFQELGMLMDYVKSSGSQIEMSPVEAQLLLDYMEGHGYLLGEQNGELVRGDICDVQGAVTWEPYSLEDAIDIVCEWNYELILEAEAKRAEPDLYVKAAGLEEQLADLKNDEVLLDRLFDQTCISREIDELAARLANEVIAIVSENKGRITDAACGVVNEIHQYSGGGRSR